MQLIVATQNVNKLREIKEKLVFLDVQGISAVDFPEELSETGATLRDNAMQKARQVYDKLKKNCFADDTGLEVDALNGEPGVLSARYAGEGKNNQENISLVLQRLANASQRTARFKTVICLIFDNKEYIFEGICEGEILLEPLGERGFGYDPIFRPLGSDKSFAQMDSQEKGSMSHRAIAVQKMVDFLNGNILV